MYSRELDFEANPKDQTANMIADLSVSAWQEISNTRTSSTQISAETPGTPETPANKPSQNAEKQNPGNTKDDLIKQGNDTLRDLAADVTVIGTTFMMKQMFSPKSPFSDLPLDLKQKERGNDGVNEKERPFDSTSDDCHVRRNLDSLPQLAKKLAEPDFTRLLPSLKETLKGSEISAAMKDGKLVLTANEGSNKVSELVVDPKTGDMKAMLKHYSDDRKTCLEEMVEAIPVANKLQQAIKAADAYKCLTGGDKQGYYEAMNGLFDAAHKARGVEGMKEAMAISKEMWTSLGAKVKEATLHNSKGDAVPDNKRSYPLVSGFSMEIVSPGGKAHTIRYETDYNQASRKYDFDIRDYLPKK